MLFDEMATAYGLELESLDTSMQTLHRCYVSRLQEGLAQPGSVEIKTGVLALLQLLSQRHDVTLGLVTGNLEEAAWTKLRAAGLEGFFLGGAFGSDARDRAALVQLAMQRLGRLRRAAYAPDCVWVIGDTPADVASGQSMGTRTLAVATGVHDVATLRACGADVVLENFADARRTVDSICHRP
jgi:phosphoglycolate phosphatase-like HAD superfamily hydrolase